MNRRIVLLLGLAALLLCAVFLDIRRSQIADLGRNIQMRRDTVQRHPRPEQARRQTEPSAAPFGTTATSTQMRPPGILHLPVLMYHYVRPLTGRLTRSQRLLTVTPESFRTQMKNLAEAGYRTITPEELRSALADGASLPEKPVLITFDDSYRGQYDYAFPILKEYRLKATLFVVSNYLDKIMHGFMDRKMLLEMDASGLITVGSHTKNHAWLAGAAAERLTDEVEGSKDDLEKLVGHPIYAFAYPYGKFDPRSKQAVQDAGYTIGFAAAAGNGHSSSTLFELRRVRMQNGQAIAPVLEKFSR